MFDQGFWGAIAVLVGIIFLVALVAGVRWLRNQRVVPESPEEAEELAHLPMTSLQRRAWWAFGLGLAFAVAIVALVAPNGVVEYSNDDSLRMTVVLLVMASIAVYLTMLGPTALRFGREDVDERDLKVMALAPTFQAGAMLVTVVAWTIYLTEEFRGVGIPTEYMYPLFGTVFLVFMLAHSAGILISYGFSRRHAQS